MSMPFNPTMIVIHSTQGKDRPDAVDYDNLEEYMLSQRTHYDKVCEQSGWLQRLIGKPRVRLVDMWPVIEIGAHCRGWNGNPGSYGRAIGYAFIGDGRVAAPSDAQLQYVARFVLADMLAWSIPFERVLMHRDMPGSNTDCPGAAFAAEWPRFVQMIRDCQ